jgi:hypothetical protein
MTAQFEVDAHISGNMLEALKVIQGQMGRLEHTTHDAFSKMQRQVDQFEKKTVAMGNANPMRAVGKSFEALPMQMAGAITGAFAGAIAFQKLTSALGDAVKAAEEQKQADLSLEAILRATQNTVGGNISQLKLLAEAYQNTTKFQDDAVQGAQGVLLQFDRLGRQTFPRALQASVDLASAMGMDLASAARSVGLALQDPETATRVLRQANIILTESEKEKLKALMDSGKAAEAQAVILGKLERAVGGHAEATATNIQKMKNQFAELQEVVGGPILVSMEKLAGFVLQIGVADIGQSLVTGFRMAASAVLPVAALVDNLVILAGKTKTAPQGMGDLKMIDQAMDQATRKEKLVSEELRKEAAKEGAEAARKKALEAAEISEKIAIDARKREVAEIARSSKEAADADEKRTKQIYDARQQLAESQAGGDPIALLKVQQQAELEAIAGNEEAKKALILSHRLDLQAKQKEIDEEDAKRKQELNQMQLAAAADFAGNMASLIGALGGKNRTAAMAAARLSQISAIINVSEGITKAYGQGGVLGLITGLSVAAAGAAQIAKIEQSIGKFAVGSLATPGGIAMVGERGPELVSLPMGSRVFNNSESRQMMGGGITHRGDVIIQMPAIPGMTLEQGRAIGREAARSYDDELKRLARMNREIQDRNISG